MIVYIGDSLSVERYNYFSIFWIRFFESFPQIGKYLKVWRWLSPQVALLVYLVALRLTFFLSFDLLCFSQTVA